MIRFFHKIQVILEKKKVLTTMEMEHEYLLIDRASVAGRNVLSLRKKLSEIREKGENADSSEKRRAVQIQAEIDETEKLRQIFASLEEKKEDLRRQIDFYVESIWN